MRQKIITILLSAVFAFVSLIIATPASAAPNDKPVITAVGSQTTTVSFAWNSSKVTAGEQYVVKYGQSQNLLTSTYKVDASKGNGVTIAYLTPGTGYWFKIYPEQKPQNYVIQQVATKTSATTPAPAPATKLEVAVVGDSNTTGLQGTLQNGVDNDYAYIVQNNDKISYAGGWARDGSTSQVMSQYVTAVPDADVAVIMAGTNDITNPTTSTLETNLKNISYKVDAGKTLILAIPPFNARKSEAASMNAKLKTIAAKNGWKFFDPWTSLRNTDNTWKTAYYLDGIHTTKAGYRVVGVNVENFIIANYK